MHGMRVRVHDEVTHEQQSCTTYAVLYTQSHVLHTHHGTHRPESSSGATSHSRGSHGVSMTPADAFVHACGCGQAAVVRRLLAAGTSSTAVHVDVVDAEGWTGLLRSIQAGYTQVSLLLLLEFGAHPEIRTPSGCSALLWAARWGRIDVVKALLSRGANSYARDEMVGDRSAIFPLLLLRAHLTLFATTLSPGLYGAASCRLEWPYGGGTVPGRARLPALHMQPCIIKATRVCLWLFASTYNVCN